MQRVLQYNNQIPLFTGTVQNISYLNIARDLSRINSKNEEITTRDGHVYGYLCRFTVEAGSAGTAFSLYTAPNTWKMRNSFRKFHAYRQMMFDNIGAEGNEIGRYGKTMRPLLDTGMPSDDSRTLTAFTADSTHQSPFVPYSAGEWSYTQLATTPLNTDRTDNLDPAGPQITWADAFYLKICEENEFDVGGTDHFSGLYSKVGMIHSYNIDRQEVVTPGIDPATGEPVEPGTIIDGPSNPLAAIRATGNRAGGEVIELIKDQELELPPYDIEDNGNSIDTPMQALVQVPTTAGTKSFTAFVPAGLARLYVNNTDNASRIEVEVLDKILCKDMA
jgi:hypothetical protein